MLRYYGYCLSPRDVQIREMTTVHLTLGFGVRFAHNYSIYFTLPFKIVRWRCSFRLDHLIDQRSRNTPGTEQTATGDLQKLAFEYLRKHSNEKYLHKASACCLLNISINYKLNRKCLCRNTCVYGLVCFYIFCYPLISQKSRNTNE